MKPKFDCQWCSDKGKTPFCVACGKVIKIRLTPEQYQEQAENARREEIARHRDNEEKKLLKRMKQNMSKTGSQSTGSITTDIAIFLLEE